MDSLQKWYSKLQSQLGIALPNLRSALTWSVGIGVLITLTIVDFLPLLAEYRSNNAATHVEVIAVDEMFQPPRVVACVRHYVNDKRRDDALTRISKHLYNGIGNDCAECKRLEEMSWDVWKDVNVSDFESPVRLYNALTHQMVKKLVSHLRKDAADDVISSKFWDEAIFAAARNFLIWQTEVDFWYEAPRDYDLHFNVSDIVGSEDASDSTTVLNLIFDNVMKAICRSWNFTMETHSKERFELRNATCEDFLLNRSIPVVLDQYDLCFPLRGDREPRTHRFNFSVIGLQTEASFWIPAPGAGQVIFTLYGDPTVQYASTIDKAQVLYRVPGEYDERGVLHYVVATYSVHMRAKETRDYKSCHKEISPAVCRAKCHKLWTIENCQCIPFSYRRGLIREQEDLPYCTEQSYANCSPVTQKRDLSDMCSSQCKEVCEYTSYKWQTNYAIYPTGTEKLKYTLLLHPDFSSFPEFTWTEKNTEEQFVTQIGGLLNIYLGFSGVSLFAFVVGLIDTVIECYQKRRRKSTVAEQCPAPCVCKASEDRILELIDKKFEELRADLKEGRKTLNMVT